MKRERDELDEPPPCDPVLAQLDFLINGPPKEARGPPAPDPVLSQLDALINPGGGAAAGPPPLTFSTPNALVLPTQVAAPPPPLPPLSLEAAAAADSDAFAPLLPQSHTHAGHAGHVGQAGMLLFSTYFDMSGATHSERGM